MHPPSEQLIRDYLNRVSVAARPRLSPDDRRAFVARMRELIEQNTRGAGQVHPVNVAVFLNQLGEPAALADRERDRLESQRRSAARVAADTGQPSPPAPGKAKPGPAGPSPAGPGARGSAAGASDAAGRAGRSGAAGPAAAVPNAAGSNAAGQGAAGPGTAESGAAEPGRERAGRATRSARLGGSWLSRLRPSSEVLTGRLVPPPGSAAAGKNAPATAAPPARPPTVLPGDIVTGPVPAASEPPPPAAPADSASRLSESGSAADSGSPAAPASAVAAGPPAPPAAPTRQSRRPDVRPAPGPDRANPGVQAQPVAPDAGDRNGSIAPTPLDSAASPTGLGDTPLPADIRPGSRRPGWPWQGMTSVPAKPRPDSGPQVPAGPGAEPPSGHSNGSVLAPFLASDFTPGEFTDSDVPARNHAVGPDSTPSSAAGTAGGDPGPQFAEAGPARSRLALPSGTLAVLGDGARRVLRYLAVRVRQQPLEAVAVVLLGLGGAVYPPVWLLGVLVTLASRTWDIRDKWLGLAFPVLAVIVGTGAAVSLGGQHDHFGAYVHEAWVFSGHLSRVVAVLGALYLAWRSQRPRRLPPPQPWNKQRRLN